MNRNYSNVDKRIWTNALMAIIVMTKTMLDMSMWDPFHNRSGVIVS